MPSQKGERLPGPGNGFTHKTMRGRSVLQIVMNICLSDLVHICWEHADMPLHKLVTGVVGAEILLGVIERCHRDHVKSHA